MGKRGSPYPPNLKRRRAYRSPKVRITVICEGKVTEPDYFLSLAQHCGALIDVQLIVERGAGVPKSIVDKAIALVPRNRARNSFEEKDQIWVVFDRDEHPNIF